MKIHKLKLSLGLFLLLWLTPSISMAYFTTGQTATKVTPDTALFTVTYKFGFTDRDVYMPIYAMQGIRAGENNEISGYTVLSSEEPVQVSNAVAVSLTNNDSVTIVDNRYFVPAGTSASFTFVALVTVDKPLDDISVLMTNLPFEMVTEERVSVVSKLNPSELQYYITPEVDLGE